MRGPPRSSPSTFEPLSEFIDWTDEDAAPDPPRSTFSILEDAREIVEDRENLHGSAVETHETIANLWTAYLGLEDDPIKAHDAALMLGLLKIARITTGEVERDKFVDLAGYAECGYRCSEQNENDHPTPHDNE